MSCDWYSAMAPGQANQQSSPLVDRLPKLTSDFRSHEKRIEFGEYAEHLISVTRSPKAIAQPSDDLILDASNPFAVSGLGCNPDLGSL